jgi:hypothetical protein
MKRLLVQIFAYAFVILLTGPMIYLGGAFVSVSFDPAIWDQSIRASCVLGFVLAIPFLLLVTEVTEYKKAFLKAFNA